MQNETWARNLSDRKAIKISFLKQDLFYDKHNKPETKSIEKFSPWICLSSFSLSCFSSPRVIVVTATIKFVITTIKVT